MSLVMLSTNECRLGGLHQQAERWGRKQSLAKRKSDWRKLRNYKQLVKAQTALSMGWGHIRKQDVAVTDQITKMLIYYAYLL